MNPAGIAPSMRGCSLATCAQVVQLYVRVGRSAVDASLSADLTLVGPVFELVDRRDYLTASSVE